MTSRWREGTVQPIDTQLYQTTARAVVRSLFSAELGTDATDEIVRSLPVILNGIGTRTYVPVNALYRLPTPGNRRFEKALRGLHAVVDSVIAEYRRAGNDHQDLLSTLLSARHQDTGDPLTDQEVHDQAVSVLSAGTDPTASTMAWVLHALATHPDIERAVHDEVDHVLGGRPVTVDDLPALDYLHRVVDEALRLYAPAWLLPRSPERDIELRGHRIPAGSQIFFSPFAIHHDPRLRQHPERFDPDRWLPHSGDSTTRCSFLPFGSGVRQCIGEPYARTLMPVVLATVTQHWRLRHTPRARIRPVAFTLLRPNRMPMIAQKRRHA